MSPRLPSLHGLVDLDRRILPRLALPLDHLVQSVRGRLPPRPQLAGTERRILGALALVLLASALALSILSS